MAKRRRRPNYEFKPDSQRVPLQKLLHLTKLQRRQILQWSLNALLCLLALILQDVIMSRVSIQGATTDLVPAMIFMICVVSDVHNGSLFALITSSVYVFSGSAPGPYALAYITISAIAFTVFRQGFWRRGFRSNALCAGLALLAYELAVYGTGVFLSLTYFSRIGVFLLTWLLSYIVMLAAYPLILRIRKIGGDTWIE